MRYYSTINPNLGQFMNITIKNFEDASEQGMPLRLKYQFAKEDPQVYNYPFSELVN
jgi:hypothetical protein